MATPPPSYPLPSDDESISSLALELGWAPDLEDREKEDILDEAEWILEEAGALDEGRRQR
ncbi:hypothetical protein SPF06_18930 [Sinomonas sp. JGH33]|uniref:Uncharacterized protein n=1 Tax=Sinomonas terricola TaxID=3110330 RepID=A0ABU5TAU7_9MICC|nr:hypothetical protein [Sinomonas sp. JGH33]MEA5456802.1 hypothetical protein [Sinomonas sp. JGH33]